MMSLGLAKTKNVIVILESYMRSDQAVFMELFSYRINFQGNIIYDTIVLYKNDRRKEMSMIKKTKSYDLIVGILLLSFERLFWSAEPNIATQYTRPSFELSMVMVLHGITALGLPLTLIALGRMLALQEKTLAKAVKFWGYTILTGIFAISIYFALQRDISPTLIYNTFLPFMRNTYPLITGIILGMMLLPLYRRFLRQHTEVAYSILGVFFILPTLFNKDIFGTFGGNSVIFALASFYLGVTLELTVSKNSPKRLLLWTTLALSLEICLLAAMPLMSQTVHGDLSTSYRFATSSSATLTLVAILFSQWTRYFPGFNLPKLESVALGGIIVSGINEVIISLVTYNAKFTGHVTSKIAKVTLGEIIICLLFIWIMTQLLCHVPTVKRLLKQITQRLPDIDQKESLTILKKQGICWLKEHRPYLVGILGAYILSYVSFLLMNTSWQVAPNVDASYNIFTYVLGPRQFQVLFNALIFVMIFKFLWSLTNRYWLAEIMTASGVIVWTIAERLKIKARNEPIMPSEFSMVKAWGSLIGMVNTWIVIATILCLFIALFVIVYLERTQPFGRKKLGIRISWLVLTLMFFNGARYMNHQGSMVHAFMEKTGNDPTFYNQLAGAQKNGPVLQFLNNLDVEIMGKPQGYSRQAMLQLKARYTKRAQVINEARKNTLGDQIVIFGLSESFSDPRRVPGIELVNDPIANVRRLKEQTTAGYMVSSGYGGGTANMEYMALTGLNLANFSPTLPTPYTQLVPHQKYAPTITAYFPESVAIHPYIGVYYSRPEVYEKFGFDRFMYLGSKYPIKHQKKIDRSPYLSDETAFANTLDQIEQAKNGLFINLVTMQNHFPYYNNYYDGSERFTPTGEAANDEGVKNMVKDFSMGLYHSDQAIKEFITRIDQIEKPITFVFYGDHLPGIYPNVDMRQNGLALHKTDYFIYSNEYARKQGAKKLTKATQLVSPTDFPALVSAQTNAKVSPYYALLTDVFEKLPVLTLDISENAINSYNTNMQLIDQTGKTISKKDLTKQQKQLLKDYRLVQYDLTAGKQYLKGSFIR